MDIIFVVGIIIVGFIILAIGGGIGYWIWLVTRTEKMTWKALVYQLGDGKIACLDKYTLNELRPYTEDIIEKIDKKNGATHYWMQKMKKAVPVITADCVEVWGIGKNSKVVRVLLQEDTCTILKAGYDSSIGEQIFRPLPHDRINMIKTELSERKERIQDKKDILSAIAPFVTIGISMIALVIAIYIIVQGAIESSQNNKEGSIAVGESVNRLSQAMLIVYGYDPQTLNNTLNNTDAREVNAGDPPMPIPP